MKKAKKVLLILLCALLLVCASVAGTVAYLSDTKSVNNTFTVGKVEITLTEKKLDVQTGKKLTGEQEADVTSMENIELVPGRVIEKNPVIKVGSASEDCYLFVKIDNGLTSVGTINWPDNSKWDNISGTSYWKYTEAVTKNATVPVFVSFTCNDTIEQYEAGVNGSSLNVTAYAIQKEGFATVDAAWTALNNQINKNTENP